jgi:soluble lytic murein transglycosylase-like protein
MHAGKVLTQALCGELQQTDREIGPGPPEQHEEAALVRHKVAARLALLAHPAQPLVAGFRLEVRAAEAEQRASLAVLVNGRVTQRLADKRRGAEVMASVRSARSTAPLGSPQSAPAAPSAAGVVGRGSRKSARSCPCSATQRGVGPVYLPTLLPDGFARRNEPALTASVILLHFRLAD